MGSMTWIGDRSGAGADYSQVGAEECTADCGLAATWTGEAPSRTSTICDPTCQIDVYGESGRFGGHLCGAGDSSKFGPSCRTCYMDQREALAADRQLEASGRFESSGRHVIMCDTRRPPQDMECSAACSRQPDTVSIATRLAFRRREYVRCPSIAPLSLRFIRFLFLSLAHRYATTAAEVVTTETCIATGEEWEPHVGSASMIRWLHGWPTPLL